jgi:hypothetical protein
LPVVSAAYDLISFTLRLSPEKSLHVLVILHLMHTLYIADGAHIRNTKTQHVQIGMLLVVNLKHHIQTSE